VGRNETILVTGAGGFIGGWLVEALHLRGRRGVRAGIRKWASAVRLGRFPVEVVLCDVLDREAIARAIRGVTCVIHCVSGSKEGIVQGTGNMLDMALEEGVERFVHLSTAEIYGDVSGEIDETFPHQDTGDVYAHSKIEAEKLCWQAYEKGLPVSVLRPSIVYGPFSKDWTMRFAQNLQSGNWGIFKGYGEGICNLIYVADLVQAVLLACTHEKAVGEAFNLKGPDSVTWNEYFRRFNAALGLPELTLIAPGSAKLRTSVMEPVRYLAKFALSHFEGPLRGISQRFRYAKTLMKSAERSIKTTPRPAELSLFNRRAVYVTTKAQKMLGYTPMFDLDTGLEMTVRWLVHLRLVDGR